MPLTVEERDFLKAIYQQLGDRPLPPGDPLYQPIYEHPGCDDPVELMQTHIEFSDLESTQMFSGFRGSGKTTELLRLQKRLKDQDCLVLYADALDYLNPAEPIDISDLLIVIAGAFSDALKDQFGIDVAGESYWTRFTNYLTRIEVQATEAAVKVEAENPARAVLGSLKAGVDLKLALKSTPSFRQQLQQFMANRLGELTENVRSFFEDGVRAIRQQHGKDRRIVFIFDSLEQLRGSLSTEDAVIRSVERVFSSHLQKLEMPYMHMVYTVPPWLQFLIPGALQIVILPSIRQWDNDEKRSQYDGGWDALRSLVQKRFGGQGCTRFFGKPDPEGHYPLADQIIGMCGGNVRDLLLLLREAVRRARSLPATQQVIESAVASVRSSFLPIAIDDALWLEKIARLRTAALPSVDRASRLTRFLDTHLVLYLANGNEWYDVHPLIREEVAEISAQQAAVAMAERQVV